MIDQRHRRGRPAGITRTTRRECWISIIATLMSMLALTWQEIAEQVRPAEDELIERYRYGLFQGDAPRAELGYPTMETPWGTGRNLDIVGMGVTGIRRLSAWPETMMVVDAFWPNFPDRRFVMMVTIWGMDWHEAEPRYNDVFWWNLAEWIVKRAMSRMRQQPGPVVYFIWSVSVDPDRPPAPGDPPRELLTARSEIAQIRSSWTQTGRES